MEVAKKELDIRTTPHKTTKKAWVVCGVALIGLSAVGWWMMKPAPTAAASSGSAIVQSAPSAAPQPLNADGAPRSD